MFHDGRRTHKIYLIPNDIRFASRGFSQKDFPLANNGPFLCVYALLNNLSIREACKSSLLQFYNCITYNFITYFIRIKRDISNKLII